VNMLHMSIHVFDVFDLMYYYRSISTYFRFDGFVSDASVGVESSPDTN
jgi:hypothetical protein